MTLRFCVTREKPELFTDIRDYTTLFYAILRCKSSEWLELYIESNLGMGFEVWSLDVSFREFALFKLAFFRDSGKRNFHIRSL